MGTKHWRRRAPSDLAATQETSSEEPDSESTIEDSSGRGRLMVVKTCSACATNRAVLRRAATSLLVRPCNPLLHEIVMVTQIDASDSAASFERSVWSGNMVFQSYYVTCMYCTSPKLDADDSNQW